MIDRKELKEYIDELEDYIDRLERQVPFVTENLTEEIFYDRVRNAVMRYRNGEIDLNNEITL